ncbi:MULTISPECIES: sensor histidine kinase [Streptomyces]|nr:histidine kinase [Streptomyces tsukubensis]AZK96919.1 two-component sensor histidine kinase [Streptomyces tsukubensis]EIF93005.1 two-component system sensor kinase [Streptomyces tsukubensis NRRL18488]
MLNRNEIGWPGPEALSRVGVPRSQVVLDVVLLGALATWAVSDAYASGHFDDLLRVPLPVLLLAFGAFLLCVFQCTTQRQLLLRSVGLLAVLAAVGWVALMTGAVVMAAVLLIAGAAMAVERLPLWAGLLCAVPLAHFFAIQIPEADTVGIAVAMAGILLGGYAFRLDAQARGAGFRLLAQERAAHEAEAVSAALAERARIAREIHDVLAHSLSAQLVHLEAARIRIERGPEGPFRDELLERVTAARGMARSGLVETRQALSALRGELTPVEEFLREIAAEEGADSVVSGERLSMPPEVSQAVRRVAQEALTNARKHAPGGRVRLLFSYEERGVRLEVRDSGATVHRGELSKSGSGYGLLGMQERAELLGGTLEVGPEGAGFMVRLRVPV